MKPYKQLYYNILIYRTPLKRYSIQSGNKYWTIYTDSSYKNPNSLNNYPNIKKHLDRFLPIFTSDNKPYGLHRARENRFFINNKIIAVRKCVGRPIFSYCDFECYISQTFNMIQTSRVNLKYLTGLLNSKLIEFWLKNKGKMQGANYQLDKEPLRQIPIAIPSDDIQEIIGKLVGIIILLNNTKNRASNLVQNSYISSEFETLIDGCVYEIYFPQEMQEIPAISTLRNYVGRFNSINISDSWELYKKIDSTGIIDSINSLSLSKSEILRTIILS